MEEMDAISKFIALLQICGSGNCVGEKCDHFASCGIKEFDGDLCREMLLLDAAEVIEQFRNGFVSISNRLDEINLKVEEENRDLLKISGLIEAEDSEASNEH